MIDSGWRAVEERATADPVQAVVAWGSVRLERGDQEFVLVAEAHQNGQGLVQDVRVALRRGGGAFLGPQGTYPAVGTIFDSVMVTLATPAVTLRGMAPGDRTRVGQAAQQLLDRAGRRLDTRR